MTPPVQLLLTRGEYWFVVALGLVVGFAFGIAVGAFWVAVQG